MIFLRGVSETGNFCLFGIEDAPVELTDNQLALTNRKYSSLIKRKTIGYYDTSLQVGEGDIIYDNNCNPVGVIIFNKGFRVVNLDTEEIKPLRDYLWDIRNLGYQILPDKLCIYLSKYKKHRISLKFKYGVGEAVLEKILIAEGEGVRTVLPKNRLIYPKNIQYFTGYSQGKSKVFFGDKLQQLGAVVGLYEGDVALFNMQDNKFIRYFEEGDVIYVGDPICNGGTTCTSNLVGASV